MLANRISLLQSEEARILKKIEHTRRKAEQILEIKRLNEQRHAEQVAIEREKELVKRSRQVGVLQTRLMQKLESEKRQNKRLELVKEEALEVKEQRQVITELKQQMRTQEVWEKKLKKEEVKGQEKEVYEKNEKRKEELLRSI